MKEVICPHCNYAMYISLQDTAFSDRSITCPRCGNIFEYFKHEEHTSSEMRHATPWESRLQMGLWKSIRQTIKMTVFSPKRMFNTMTVKGGLREPLAFGLLIGSISSMFSFFWEFLFAVSGFFNPLGAMATSLSSPVIYIYLIFISPVLVIVDLFISSFIVHILLIIVRAGNNRFEATFRAVAYSQAAKLWSIIPFIGGPVGWIWRGIVQIIGFKEAHETSYTRIAVAFFIPLILLSAIVAGVFLLLINF